MRYIDRFDMLLLDMGNTFMFGGDRFSESEAFGITYRRLGGTMLNDAVVRQITCGVFETMYADYCDPSCYHSFGSLATYYATHPVARTLPASEVALLEAVFAHHEIGTISAAHVATLKALRQTHRLGLVSNIWAPSTIFYDCFRQCGILNLFDVIVFSSDHGSIKPAPALFEKAIDTVDVSAARIVYIGDDLHRDVEGAKRMGLHTVWINPDLSQMSPEPDVTIRDLHTLLTLKL